MAAKLGRNTPVACSVKVGIRLVANSLNTPKGVFLQTEFFKKQPKLFKIFFVDGEDIIAALFAANNQFAVGKQLNVMRAGWLR